MKNSTILIVVGKLFVESDLVKELEAIRALPAHAAVLVVGETPPFPYYALGVPMYGPIDISPEWQEAVAANNAELVARAEDVKRLLDQHDISGEVATVGCTLAEVDEAIARRAMLCDMAIVGDDLRQTDELFRQVVHGVLFQSPIGILLNGQDPALTLAAKTVFVAWNTGLPAARALHQALPILRQAKEVIIATIDPVATEYGDGEDPGVDAAKWLSHHGCTVSVRQYTSGGREIGDVILERSKECGAELVVMGSYGHSRTRQAIFGGTTRTLIAQRQQAVFLGH